MFGTLEWETDMCFAAERAHVLTFTTEHAELDELMGAEGDFKAGASRPWASPGPALERRGSGGAAEIMRGMKGAGSRPCIVCCYKAYRNTNNRQEPFFFE